MTNGIRAFHSSVDNQNYLLTKSPEGLQFSRVETNGTLTPLKCKAYDTYGSIPYAVRADGSLRNMRIAERVGNLDEINYSVIGRDGRDFTILGKSFKADGLMENGKVNKLNLFHIDLKKGEELAPLAKRFLTKVAEFVSKVR